MEMNVGGINIWYPDNPLDDKISWFYCNVTKYYPTLTSIDVVDEDSPFFPNFMNYVTETINFLQKEVREEYYLKNIEKAELKRAINYDIKLIKKMITHFVNHKTYFESLKLQLIVLLKKIIEL